MFEGKKEVELLEKILQELRVIASGLKPKAQSATLTIGGSNMGFTAAVNSAPAKAVFSEFEGPSGTGPVIAPVGAVTFSSDNAAVATVDHTGQLAYVAAGTAVISAVDAGNSLTASETLTLTPVAQSATLVIG